MRRSKRPEPQTELERLQRENEYLRAENALLKKVRTLMQEKRNRRVGIGQSPSEH
jgi:transposase-like protein